MTAPLLAAIAGPSCSGKTTIAARLAELLGAQCVTRFSLDSYYLDLSGWDPRDIEAHNFDEPDALEWPLMREDVQRLARGETIHAPVYSFADHARCPETQLVIPRDYVLLEGLFALHDPVLRGLCAATIYVDASESLCLERRITRDIAERGRTHEATVAQIEATVQPMARQYVIPSRRYATLVLDGAAPLEQSAQHAAAYLQALRASREHNGNG